MRTKYSDDELRPSISIGDADRLNNSLTEMIAKLGAIHRDNPEYHRGEYKELLLTNRQYAFARFIGEEACVTAVNNDDKEVNLRIPIPFSGNEAVSLFDGTVFPIEGGFINLLLKGNEGIVLKIASDHQTN